jgi:hypothetical protein
MDRSARRQRRPDGRRAARCRLQFLDGRLAGCFGPRHFVSGGLNVRVHGRRRLCRFHGFRLRRAFFGRLAFRLGFRRCIETIETT